MTLKVYTSNYDYEGKHRLDITVKTGLYMFAPTWEMVNEYKYEGNKEKYTKLYYEKMRRSYQLYGDIWRWLLTQDKVVLVCFCKRGEFCHRYLLKDMLVKLGATYMGEC